MALNISTVTMGSRRQWRNNFPMLQKKRTCNVELAKLDLKRLGKLHKEIHIVRGEAVLATGH